MTYKGIVQDRRIELEGGAILPEGTRVTVIPEEPFSVVTPGITLQKWLHEARQVRAMLPATSDSVEILRQLREGRAGR